MNRTYSTLIVLLLGLVAIGVCLRQTLEISNSLESTTKAILIFVQVAVVLAIVTIGFAVLKRSGFVSAFRPIRFAAVRPLRRLLSAVWS